MDLRHTDLTNSNWGPIYGLDFSDSVLQRIRITQAATSCIFSGANLTDADLTNADLTGSKFDAAILQRTKFNSCTVDGAVFTMTPEILTADFSGAHDLSAAYFLAMLDNEQVLVRGITVDQSGRLYPSKDMTTDNRPDTKNLRQVAYQDLRASHLEQSMPKPPGS